jgi:predicted hydrolase (HD superfamily)
MKKEIKESILMDYKPIKDVSEMYALGCISLTQVAEVVEKYPLVQQTSLMETAMKYAKEYYEDYEKWMKASMIKEL